MRVRSSHRETCSSSRRAAHRFMGSSRSTSAIARSCNAPRSHRPRGGAVPEQLSLHDQLHVRLEEKLRRELGSAVLDALADPGVIEIMLNPDGRLWIDELCFGMRDTGVRIGAAQAEN